MIPSSSSLPLSLCVSVSFFLPFQYAFLLTLFFAFLIVSRCQILQRFYKNLFENLVWALTNTWLLLQWTLRWSMFSKWWKSIGFLQFLSSTKMVLSCLFHFVFAFPNASFSSNGNRNFTWCLSKDWCTGNFLFTNNPKVKNKEERRKERKNVQKQQKAINTTINWIGIFLVSRKSGDSEKLEHADRNSPHISDQG